MKKTITLLLAAAGLAIAADDINPIGLNFVSVEENGSIIKKTATLNSALFAENAFSVVLTLDFKALSSGGGDLFLVNGTTHYPSLPNDTNPASWGMKHYYMYEDYGWDYYEESNLYGVANSSQNSQAINYNLLNKQPDYADVVYSYKVENNESVLTTTMYFYNGNHEKIDNDYVKTYTNNKNYLTTYTSIDVLSSAVTNLQLYNVALEGDEQIQTALNTLKGNTPPSTPGDGNVPEPATATLSLLALAGLAARRRRR